MNEMTTYHWSFDEDITNFRAAGIAGIGVWRRKLTDFGEERGIDMLRESGLIDWRAVLSRCLDLLGRGNLPPEVLGKVSAWPQRICHDSREAIWEVLDHVAANVMDQVRSSEPQLFREDGELHYENARAFRRWARLFEGRGARAAS